MYIIAFGIWLNVFLLYRDISFVSSTNQIKVTLTHVSSDTDCPQPISHEVVGLFTDILVNCHDTETHASNMPCDWLISLLGSNRSYF